MTIFDLIVFALIAIIFRNLTIATFIFIILEIIYIILCKLKLGHYVEVTVNKQIKKNGLSKERYTEFYDDYFNRIRENTATKLYYKDIEKVVETDTNFYLKYGKNNDILIIQKNRCSFELINFIREKFVNIEKYRE